MKSLISKIVNYYAKFFGLIGYASYDSLMLEKMSPSDCWKKVLANPNVYIEPNEY